MNARSVDEAQVTTAQAIVLRPARGVFVRHLILEFKESKQGLQFLNELNRSEYQPRFDGDEGRQGDVELNIGFSYRGLQCLGIPRVHLAVFNRLAPAFAEGAPARAAAHLGDTGPSAAERWEAAFKQEAAHALITIHGASSEALNRCTNCIKGLANPLDAYAGGGVQPDDRRRVQIHGTLDGESLGAPNGEKGEWVHFGFRDGLTGVRIRGLKSPPCGIARSYQEHEAGELILGRPNDAGYNPWVLATSPEKLRRFFADGSFGVLRKMEQNEALFNDKVDQWAAIVMAARNLKPDGENLKQQYRDYVKAKLCGRWPSGQLFGPDGEHGDPGHEASRDFNFDLDEEGLGCPYGAHIRRMNPRGHGVVHVRQRPLMRRGTPYGKRADASKPDDEKRGLLGLFYCASLEDQFEHLLGQWGDRKPIGPDDRGNSKDPLVGNHEDSDAVFHIRCAGGKEHKLSGFAPFVTTRGTMYAFYPGRQGLDLILADNYSQEDDEEGRV